MRLGVKPAVFFGRLLLFFFLTYFLWRPLEPVYTQLLAHRPRTHESMNFVDHEDNITRLTDFVDDRFQPFLKFSPKTGSGD